MFERYTEGARRTIFFARCEASQSGASEIEPEHLLLGILRQSNILGSGGRAIRDEIEKGLAHREKKTSTSVDLPISTSVKRALAYGAEESERANHQHIEVEHLFLGLLRESEGIAALLAKHGMDREKVLSAIPPETEQEQANRESLHALADKLPDAAFGRAKRMLENMQNWPPVPGPRPFGFPDMPPGMGGGWAGGGGRARAGGWRRSSTRVEDGAEVFETQHFYRGHEITLTERYRMSEDGNKLTYSVEVQGPGKTLRQTVDFDLSAE